MKPLPREAFAPAPSDEVLERPPEARPVTLLAVMAKNRRAQLAAGVVVLLALFALLGPLVWTQDPSQQWLSQISRGPMGAQAVRVVIEPGRWQPEAPAPPSLTVIEAHTQWVRLRWPSTPGADSYRVYRSDEPEGESLGIPLGETHHPRFEDRLNLRPKRYRYTVVAYSGTRESGERLQEVIEPQAAITLFEAQLQGLLPPGAEAGQLQGRELTLPAHPLGTDSLGRDMLARLIHGARTSLFVGVMAPLLFIAAGTLYGALAGLLGGGVDNWLMRGADFVIALPFLLFMILLRVAFGIGPGESGIFPLIVALVLLGWPASARLVRGQVLKLRNEAYVSAARLAGAGNLYLIRRHLLPNVLPIILVTLSFAIPMAIFTEAFLSFIGMGVSPPTPSWGSLCRDGLKSLLVHPHELLFPAAMISVSVLAFNMLGEALRDAIDVKLRTEPL